MWTKFCQAKKDFIPCYTVYHYFRSKGWVPKSGIKYGTDFGKNAHVKHVNKLFNVRVSVYSSTASGDTTLTLASFCILYTPRSSEWLVKLLKEENQSYLYSLYI